MHNPLQALQVSLSQEEADISLARRTRLFSSVGVVSQAFTFRRSHLHRVVLTWMAHLCKPQCAVVWMVYLSKHCTTLCCGNHSLLIKNSILNVPCFVEVVSPAFTPHHAQPNVCGAVEWMVHLGALAAELANVTSLSLAGTTLTTPAR